MFDKCTLMHAPLRVVESIYDKCLQAGNSSVERICSELEHRLSMEFPDKQFDQIVSLNEIDLSTLENGCLSRVRCMIQDMRPVEFVPIALESSGGSSCCMFRDSLDGDAASEFSCDNMSNIVERYVYCCVPVPNEADWIHNKLRSLKSNFKSDANSEQSEPVTKKPAIQECPTIQPSSTFSCTSWIVKSYRQDDFKLNEIVEFVGILEKDNSTASHQPVTEVGLHSIVAQRMEHSPISSISPEFSWISNTRSHLLHFLQNGLQGDQLAAEYLLCSLISSSLHQNTGCMGKFALNLYNVPVDDSDLVGKICKSLQQICSKVHYLPLSLDVLNREHFVPKKNYDTDSLVTGRLQMPAGSLLIIDETKLRDGRLFEQGVRNISALKTLIAHQKVDYDFVFHGIEFTTDINILILSEGVSCLSSDCAVKLICNPDVSEIYFDAGDIENFRTYLLIMKSKQLEIGDEMQTKIKQDFVEMRQNDKDLTQTKLHELLTLSRWLTCSFGLEELSLDCWQKAQTMEGDRLFRKK